MADRSRLVHISSKKDDSPNRFSKEAVKEEVLDIFIPIATNTLLTSFPIFLARLSLVRTPPFVGTKERSLFLEEFSSSKSSHDEKVGVYQ
jgi:hypothetical protein